MSKKNKISMPPQRLSYYKKNKKWRQSNVDYADGYSFYNNQGVRQTLENKVINLNLYNGIVNIKDMIKIVNPNNLDTSYTPDNIPHNPIVVPKIDLLVGEESKRRFDWSAIVVNANAISKKENDKKDFLNSKIQEFLQANYEDEELQLKMKDLQKYMKFEYQDVREKMVTQILKHYWYAEEFALKFTKGFKDALILAEEIYQVDAVHQEPVLTKLNPLKVHAIRNGNSDRIEDSNIIILEDHWSPGKIVDYFHDQLKEKDIDHILDYSNRQSNSSSNSSFTDDQNNHVLFGESWNGSIIEGYLDSANINGHGFGSDYTDSEGNIRVLRVYWKSLKAVLKVKYYDEYGDVAYKVMSEEYIVDKNRGEEATKMWVNEWWEGTKIGLDIYLQMKPKPVQFNRLNNPSKCHPGIIGQIYNTNQGKAVSLMDRCKNLQYLYDGMYDRLNKAIATNYGKIFELDISKIPDNWEMDKWMHFMVVNKIAVVDGFKEGNQGAATGKLAGGMNGMGGRSIDMETGNYIQQHINLLQFIKMEMGEIAGVSEQRQGQISNRETVGGVERAVTQSSHITEYWFMLHERVKLRVMSAFLEVAKYCLKDNTNKKAQYILDDQSIQILNTEDVDFCEEDYDIVVANSSKATELEQSLKQYAQAFLQNGGNISTIMDIYFSDSISDMRRRIEHAEDIKSEQDSAQMQEQSKQMEAQRQQAEKFKMLELQSVDNINIRDNDTKRYIAEIGSLETSDTDGDGITDLIENDKLNLDIKKQKDDQLSKILSLNNDMKKHNDNIQIKNKQINKNSTNKK